MSSEQVFPLDKETIELFAMNGTQGSCGTPQVGNANGLKARRVVQLIRDFSKQPLDTACGDAACAIESPLQGAT